MNKDDLATPPAAQPWTRIDTYVTGLARQRSASRRRLDVRPRSEPERPRLLLSTVPFVVMLAILGMLFVAIASLAWPRSQPPQPVAESAQEKELGTAGKGWFQEAEKEFAAANRG